MKLRGILIATLFPFLHATSYPATLVHCDDHKIVIKSENDEFDVTLFNTKITNEKGREKACAMLKEAKHIRFELDPSTKVEVPIPVYLFADDALVQEMIIKEGYAYPMIHNPEYTYEKRLEQAFDTTQTMAKPVKKKQQKQKHYPYVGRLYLGSGCLLWLAMFGYAYKKHQKKQLDKKAISADE